MTEAQLRPKACVLKVLWVQSGLRKQITHKSCCAMITQPIGFQIVPYLLPDCLHENALSEIWRHSLISL